MKTRFYYGSGAEYAYTLRVDEITDVYSLGEIILELMTGRLLVGEYGEGVDLVQWTRITTDGLQENIGCMLDLRLMHVAKDDAMHQYFVATMCVQDNSIERPSVKDVVQMLSGQNRRSPQSHTSSLTTFR
ncbi:hypothetical protein MLD38_025599 [Melastoma candidum]|uniref:Uncharacterized protein n=1 Tax=Melastoma candidum TaxID=119954 RepID=A0ACB9NVV9_9MYRT|nr:hypothetical protein MLD38_025599 [Melastoma candidum]